MNPASLLPHLVYSTYIPDGQLYRIASTKCHINPFVPPDDGPGEVQNM